MEYIFGMSLIKKIAQLMLEVVFRGIHSQEEADILYHSFCKKKKDIILLLAMMSISSVRFGYPYWQFQHEFPSSETPVLKKILDFVLDKCILCHKGHQTCNKTHSQNMGLKLEICFSLVILETALWSNFEVFI